MRACRRRTCARVGEDVGRHVAAMHDGGLIHGDLTTSNILVREDDGRVVIIDFGLAHNSIIAEDKGVDLYVLERAVTVTAAAAKLFEGGHVGVQDVELAVERELQQVRGGAHAREEEVYGRLVRSL